MAKIYTNIEDLNGHFKQKKYFAEKVVFDVLIKKLDSSWSVYYSVDWIGNAENESMIRDGEIDFVLTNLKYGFYVVEVKGGVEVFKEDKSWYSVDSRHEKHKIKNPFNQAKDNKYFIKIQIN